MLVHKKLETLIIWQIHDTILHNLELIASKGSFLSSPHHISNTASIIDFSIVYVCLSVVMVFLQVTDKFMNSPLQILLKEEEIALDGILQFHVSVQREDHKFSTLCDIYEVPVYIT